MNLLRLWHTLSDLKFIQITSRIKIILKKIIHKKLKIKSTKITPPTFFNIMITKHQNIYIPSWGGPYFLDHSLCLINKINVFDLNQPWKSPNHQDPLWLYHFHYFEYLHSDFSADQKIAKALLDSWIDQHPMGSKIAWDPYPCSLRITHWILWALKNNPLSDTQNKSLFTQAAYLSQNLETHLLGNHYFENGIALVFAGTYFKNLKFKNLGLKILKQQIPEQILEDGGHFERSPMYHCVILFRLLHLKTLEKIAGETYPLPLEKTILKMLRWLNIMSHPDGEISFFNDSCFNIAPNFNFLKNYAESLNIFLSPSALNLAPLEHLKNSGFIRLTQDNLVCLIDVGNTGPRYIPGHAHAESLSFELSLWGQRVFVNSGTSTYHDLDLRAFQRSTPAHNTVQINHTNSSDIWSKFRVGKKAKIIKLNIKNNQNPGDASEIKIVAAHNGYDNQNIIHERTFILTEKKLLITDQIFGNYLSAQSFLHLDPSCIFNSQDSLINLKTGAAVLFKSNQNWQSYKTYFYDSMNLEKPNYSLCSKWNGAINQFEISAS